MKKTVKKFQVICWNPNKAVFEPYDILPYLRETLDERKKRFKNYKRTKEYKKCMEQGGLNLNEYKLYPQNREELRTFIRDRSLYRWWAKTEYEIILKDWPCGRNEEKIDIYWQVMMNIDIITDILAEEYNIK